MANTFLTTQLISNTALALFAVNSPYIQTANRGYQAEFSDTGYKIGSSIQIRKQVQTLVGDGQVATPQPIVEQVETLTVNHQYHDFINYNMVDLSLKIDDFSRLFIQPAIQRIKAKMEKDISLAAEQQLYLFAGSSNSSINSYGSIDRAGEKLLAMNVDLEGEAYQVLSLRDASTLKGSFQNSFTPVMNEKIMKTASLGHLSYFDLFQSQQVSKHTSGLGGTTYSSDTVTVTNTTASGSTLVLGGATHNITGYFLPGDMISIQNTSQLGPFGDETGDYMQFVVTSTSDSDNSGVVTITVDPPIVSDITNPYRNIGAPIAAGSQLNVSGDYNNNVAYIPRALDIVCPPLGKLAVKDWAQARDPKSNLSLTIAQQGDIVTYSNYMRIDLLVGFKWHPQYAVKNLAKKTTGAAI